MASQQLGIGEFWWGRAVVERVSSEVVNEKSFSAFDQLLMYSVQQSIYQYLLGGKYSLPLISCDYLASIVRSVVSNSKDLPFGRYVERP